MYDNRPKTIRQINAHYKEDCFQLLTLEGDHFSQIKGINTIAKKLEEKFPNIKLCLSSNDHDFGTYYGLEILDSSFKEYPQIENDSFVIAEELGYDI